MDRRGMHKRHSFPLQAYSWNNIIRGPTQFTSDGDLRIPFLSKAPVITSQGTQEERESRLEEALLWIRKELADMRHQDKFLTRQFIQLRTAIQRIKTENEMLDDLQANGHVEHGDDLSDLSPRKVIPRDRDGRPLIRKSYSMVV